MKRSSEEDDDVEDSSGNDLAAEEFEEDSPSFDVKAKCQKSYWRCVAKVVKGGLKYMKEPQGLSG